MAIVDLKDAHRSFSSEFHEIRTGEDLAGLRPGSPTLPVIVRLVVSCHEVDDGGSVLTSIIHIFEHMNKKDLRRFARKELAKDHGDTIAKFLTLPEGFPA